MKLCTCGKHLSRNTKGGVTQSLETSQTWVSQSQTWVSQSQTWVSQSQTWMTQSQTWVSQSQTWVSTPNILCGEGNTEAIII